MVFAGGVFSQQRGEAVVREQDGKLRPPFDMPATARTYPREQFSKFETHFPNTAAVGHFHSIAFLLKKTRGS